MRLPLHYLLITAVLVALGIYFYGHHVGWSERDKEMEIQIARKNDEARAKETELREQIDTTSTQLKEAHDTVNQKQSALDRAIRSGRLRLPAPSCVQASPGAPAPAGDRDETRSQSDGQTDAALDAERATLAAIAAIVAQGDRNTAQLNACIDAYNEVRNTLNDQRQPAAAASH